MNRNIKALIDTLGTYITYDSEYKTLKLFKDLIKSGKLKPKYSVDFVPEGYTKESINGMAVTLSTGSVGEHYKEVIEHGEIVRTLDYTVHARIQEDYYEWVNFFVCVSDNGKDYVVGDCEDTVYFTSKKFYNKLFNENEVEVWNYEDI